MDKKYLDLLKEIKKLQDENAKLLDLYNGEKCVREYYENIIKQFELILGVHHNVED